MLGWSQAWDPFRMPGVAGLSVCLWKPGPSALLVDSAVMGLELSMGPFQDLWESRQVCFLPGLWVLSTSGRGL